MHRQFTVFPGNIRISIRQNGYEIYQSTLPPGPFEINDIYPAGSGGDLQVTLQEADGSVQRFNVPWSSVPVLQREGHLKYALSAGEFRSGGHQQDNPRFAEGTLKYGLPAGWTVYGGARIAERYRAFNLGWVKTWAGWVLFHWMPPVRMPGYRMKAGMTVSHIVFCITSH